MNKTTTLYYIQISKNDKLILFGPQVNLRYYNDYPVTTQKDADNLI